MSEFKTYLSVGVINFLICIITMKILANLNIHYSIYTAIGYSLAICCSFFLNLKFTFQNSQFSLERFFKFSSISFINLALVEVIEYCLIETVHTQKLIALIIGMAWYTITGFLINKFYVYNVSHTNSISL
jgi:putative flippase GtrA